MKLKNTLSIAVGALLVASTSQVMAQGEGAVEFDVNGRYVNTGDNEIKDGGMAGVTAGYFVTDDVELALSYGEYFDMKTKRHSMASLGKDKKAGINPTKRKGKRKWVNGNVSELNAIYHYGEIGANSLRPYVSGGVGHMSRTNADKIQGTRNQRTTANLGAGLKWYITEDFFTKLSLDAQYGIEKRRGSHNWDYLGGLGLGFNFGGNPPVAPAPQEETCEDVDNDGICDNLDKCLNTPPNTNIDGEGCPIVAEAVRVQLDVKFDFNKAVVKKQYYGDLESVANFMKQYPQTTTSLNGYTDGVGGQPYNMRLSERRANAVRDVLVNEMGIEPGRIQAVGHGKNDPIATNDTDEGRSLNRRVEATLESMGQPAGNDTQSQSSGSEDMQGQPSGNYNQ